MKYIIDEEELEHIKSYKIFSLTSQGFKKIASGMVDYDKEYDGKIYISGELLVNKFKKYDGKHISIYIYENKNKKEFKKTMR